VAKYHNKKETKRIGIRIQELRLSKELSIEDISSMTGFTRTTITSIEKGANTDTSHLLEIAKALGIHPKEVFNLPFDIKPRFKLSPKRLNNNKITLRLNKLSSETDFFKTPKYVSDVVKHLKEEFEIRSDATTISVVLKRLVTGGKLVYTKNGRKNIYTKKKK
jgi:transcriptional regulator with XRE-family HTH domain